jgi:CBS domain-containing membrane protein
MMASIWSTSKKHVIGQTVAAVVFVALVLLAMNLVSSNAALWAVGSSALASSAYIVFALSKGPAAMPRSIVGGYFIAGIVGWLFHITLVSLYGWVANHNLLQAHPNVFWITASLSVGVSMLLMIILECQHPPAAGVALVLVLNVHEIAPVMVIFTSAVVLATLRWLLGNRLVSLVK